MFKKNNILIPYTQVTINSEDEKEKEKASPEQVLVALKEQKKLRGIKDDAPAPKKKKLKKVVNQMKESFDKTTKEMDD